MLGFSEGYGQALRKKNRWLWFIALIGVTFLFLSTLLNPRGDLSQAMEEGKVLVFVIASCAFMVVAFIIYLIYGRERKTPALQPAGMPSVPPVMPTATPMPPAVPAPTAPPPQPPVELKSPPPLKAEEEAVTLPPLPKNEEQPKPVFKAAVVPPLPSIPEAPKPVVKAVSMPPLPPSDEKKQPPSLPPLPAASRTCANCGTSNPPDAKFCANCGTKLG
jgi:outer membrane biosynthesis protein TonB